MGDREGRVRAVVEGLNGRLFLGDQGGFWIDRYMSSNPFSPSYLERWRRALRRRARELKRRGIPYVVYVVPDAHFIHAEDLPPQYAAMADVSPGERFLAAMSDLSDIVFVTPRRELEAAKGLLEIYRKTDSHWSFYGSFVGYRVLAAALARLLPISTLRARDVGFEYRPMFGDLGATVVPERQEDTPRTVIDVNPYDIVYANEGFRRNGILETYSAGAADARILFGRDSFFTFLADYISRSFRHMLCVGSTTSFFLDEVDRWKPNVVVSELGERRLFFVESDHVRDGFDDLFRSDFSSERGRIAQRALSLLSAHRIDEALAEIESLETAADLDPDHAYAVAQVLFGAGHHERSARAVAAARASHPERPSFLSLDASIALARGDLARARKSAEHALAGAPHNGYHHQTYATVLINDRAPDAARRHIEATLPEIDDAGVLWYLYSLTCEATGDRATANEAIIQAMMLDPSDANFRARAKRLWES